MAVRPNVLRKGNDIRPLSTNVLRLPTAARRRRLHRLFATVVFVLGVGPDSATAQSSVNLTGSKGDTQDFEGTPALWNAYLPNFGRPKLSQSTPLDRESCNVQPSFVGRVVLGEPVIGHGQVGHLLNRTLGCTPLYAAPVLANVAVLLDRGSCSFREKARNVYKAGYKAFFLVNTVPGKANVPDMQAKPTPETDIEVPAWAFSQEDGDALRSWLAQDQSIRVSVIDDPRRVALGLYQEDGHGFRKYLSA